jgi:hypothetical protein
LNDHQDTVEISYQVISEALGIITVAIFKDNQLLHIISGRTDMMMSKLNQIFN